MSKKNIVITGATGGVGRLLAKGLAKKGNHIICLGRNTDRLKELVYDINFEGGSASFEVEDSLKNKTLRIPIRFNFLFHEIALFLRKQQI